MPLYEYECETCGKRFERIQKFSDPPVAECPTCGGPVKKLVSSPAIQFKGSGWYITDYARKSGGEGASKSTAESKDSKDTDTSAASGDSASKPATASSSSDGGSKPAASSTDTKNN